MSVLTAWQTVTVACTLLLLPEWVLADPFPGRHLPGEKPLTREFFSATILCRVRDEAGKPFRGAWVTVDGSHYAIPDGYSLFDNLVTYKRVTDRWGQCAFPKHLPGKYTVYVEGDKCFDRSQSVQAFPNKTVTVAITLHKWHRRSLLRKRSNMRCSRRPTALLFVREGFSRINLRGRGWVGPLYRKHSRCASGGYLSQNEFDNTLQLIQRLTPGPHQPPLMSEAVQAAAEFVVGVRKVMAGAGGPLWQTPLVEDGGAGAVVLLWQDGQRTLSLVAKPGGALEWLYEPGAAGYGVNPLDLLRKGDTSAEDFAGHIWPAWVSGSDPVAE